MEFSFWKKNIVMAGTLLEYWQKYQSVDDVGWVETNQGGSPRLKPEQVRNWIVGLKPHASPETRIGDLGLNRDGAKYPTPAEGRLEWATQR
jgi:hypothetical protein